MEKQGDTRMVRSKLNVYEIQIKELTQQVYHGYKRIKELSDENEELKRNLERMRNDFIPLR